MTWDENEDTTIYKVVVNHEEQGPRVGPTNPFIEFKGEEIEQSITERFDKIVREYPQQLAVKMGDLGFTYDQLNQRANRIAHGILEKHGAGSEPVALLFEHGVDVIPAIFGILKAGKFFVALDSSFPLERMNHILEDSGAELIVTNSRNVAIAHALANGIRTLLNIEEIDESVLCDNIRVPVSGQHLVNIMYTSGSTGEPKGVVGIWKFLIDRLEVSANDKLTLLHPVSSASSVSFLFKALLNGAGLFPFDIKSQGIHRLVNLLKEEQITVYKSTPVVFRQLANLLPSQNELPSIRLIKLSGAPVTKLDFELFKQKFPPGTLLGIGMGSTEGRGTCSAVLDHTFSFPEEGTPVGYPAAGNRIFLLNENGQEVGPGDVGEIAVKGRKVNPGYWRKPNLTNTKFVPDPESGDERIYLTGDLGKMLPDGFVIHLGRKDFMVKIRGYRVELGEVEKRLLEHPLVKETGVAAWSRENEEKYLAAYVVPRENAKLTAEDLRAFLQDKLPDYMIPSAFVKLDALPLTPSGKVDRKALPVPDSSRPELGTPFVAPRSPTEEKLAKIWAGVLSLDQVGIHDNFFDLGGHSLAATRVISRVINTFKIELPIKSLFESPTVAEMAGVITQNMGKGAGDEELARMLAELEVLSDEEAQRLLAQEMREKNV